MVSCFCTFVQPVLSTWSVLSRLPSDKLRFIFWDSFQVSLLPGSLLWMAQCGLASSPLFCLSALFFALMRVGMWWGKFSLIFKKVSFGVSLRLNSSTTIYKLCDLAQVTDSLWDFIFFREMRWLYRTDVTINKELYIENLTQCITYKKRPIYSGRDFTTSSTTTINSTTAINTKARTLHFKTTCLDICLS